MKPGLCRFLTFLSTLVCLLTLVYVTGIRLNLTSSMPVGLYYFSSNMPTRGDIVAVCLPEKFTQEGLTRHYLFYGYCHAHSMAVLKRLIAVPGDEVIVDDAGMTVNGQTYAAPQQNMDSNNMLTTHFIPKNSHHASTGFWLYGENNFAYSWDSRYYGGIEKQAILGAYKPLWVMN